MLPHGNGDLEGVREEPHLPEKERCPTITPNAAKAATTRPTLPKALPSLPSSLDPDCDPMECP